MHPSVISAWRKFNEPNEGWLNFMFIDAESAFAQPAAKLLGWSVA